MDPNETLRQLREAIDAEEVGEDGSYAAEIVELFQALDKWLTEGNFLPIDWIPRSE